MPKKEHMKNENKQFLMLESKAQKRKREMITCVQYIEKRQMQILRDEKIEKHTICI